MKITTPGRRKAISPVLATVILIAITLIAAIAIAGFVFGLFGSFTSSAQVRAQVTSCSVGGKNCVITMANSGTSNTVVNSCSVMNAGASEGGALSAGAPSATYQVAAGGSETLTCTVAAVGSAVGSQAVGSLALSNGATVPFTATWTT